jgi:clan AA aspartic protease
MITGVVNARLEATFQLTVHGAGGQQVDVEVVVDTGYTGSLTLPSPIVTSLGLAWHSTGIALLADASVQRFDRYEGTVIWDGAPQYILIDGVETNPLVGTRLLADHDLRIQLIPGGSVTIEALP